MNQGDDEAGGGVKTRRDCSPPEHPHDFPPQKFPDPENAQGAAWLAWLNRWAALWHNRTPRWW